MTTSLLWSETYFHPNSNLISPNTGPLNHLPSFQRLWLWDGGWLRVLSSISFNYVGFPTIFDQDPPLFVDLGSCYFIYSEFLCFYPVFYCWCWVLYLPSSTCFWDIFRLKMASNVGYILYVIAVITTLLLFGTFSFCEFVFQQIK